MSVTRMPAVGIQITGRKPHCHINARLLHPAESELPNMKTIPKNRARVKISIPTVAEVELSREWQADDDNVIHYGDQVAIRACDGTYWQANGNDFHKLMSIERHIKEWEIFQIVAADDEFVAVKNRPVRFNDKVAFWFAASKSFIGARLNDNDCHLTAVVPWVKAWETFTLVEYPNKPSSSDKKVRFGSWFALTAANGKHVMFDRDGTKQLLAVVPHIREWEGFVFIHPSVAK